MQVRRVEGLDAVQKLLVQGAGKRSMDAVRQALDGLEQEERRLLGVRETASRRAEGRVLVVSTTALVLALLLFGAAFLAFRREQRRRAAAEVVLQQFNTELEARVTQRTSDLTQANQSLAAAQARLRLIIETVPECVKVVSPRGELLEMNAAGLTMLDAASLAELAGQPLLRYIAPQHQKAFVALHGEVMAGGAGVLEFETIGLRGTRRWLETPAVPLRARTGEVTALLGVTRDVTARRQAEAIVACQTAGLELIARGAPLAETFTTLLRSMEAFAPGMLCSVVLLEEDGTCVQHSIAPSLPEGFSRALEGQLIGPRAGSCGTAAFRREAVIVEDIATDPLWADYRELALAHGLRACWSTPIFDAQQRVLGTFAIYYREPGRPTEQHRRCIGVATHLAAVAIDKQRADAALRVSESRHRRLVESNIIGVMIANTDGRITESNDLFLRTVGYTRADLEAGRLRWDAMTPPGWRAVDEHILRELQAAGTCQPVEKEYLRKDGTRVPILASVAMLEGTPGTCICLIADMTARKQAEQERQKFVLLAESSTEFIGMCDLDLQRSTWTRRACAWSGCPTWTPPAGSRCRTISSRRTNFLSRRNSSRACCVRATAKWKSACGISRPARQSGCPTTSSRCATRAVRSSAGQP